MGLQTTPERVCQTLYKSDVFFELRFLLVAQEDLSPCGTRRHVFLWHNRTRLLVAQEDMSSCGTRRHVFLCHKKTFLLVTQEDMFSCDTRKHVFLCHKKTCFLPPKQETPELKKLRFFTFEVGPILDPQKLKTYHFYTMCFRTPRIHFFSTFWILVI